MMTLEQIRERNRKENAAARRLQAAGYRLEGWDPPHRAADRRTNHRREHQRRAPHVLQLSHLAGCRGRASGLNAHRMPWQSRTGQSGPAPLPRQPPGDHPEQQTQRTKENEP